MLNYLWAGLIISSFVFAIVKDTSDVMTGRFDPGGPVAAVIDGENATIDLKPFGGEGTVTGTIDGDKVTFAGDLPSPLDEMATFADPDDGELVAELADGTVVFKPVRLTHLAAIQRAAIDMAGTAVTISIGLIGVMALWLGLLKIGEAAGMIAGLVFLVRPLLGWLFPQVPKDHPALGLIALNLMANVLGLGNSATPLGIKAMESLQTLNPTDDTATDPMVMLLAMNTASVTLVPPVSLVAIMGFEAGLLTPAIWVTTAFSLVIAIAAAKLYGRLPVFRRSNPNLAQPEVA